MTEAQVMGLEQLESNATRAARSQLPITGRAKNTFDAWPAALSANAYETFTLCSQVPRTFSHLVHTCPVSLQYVVARDKLPLGK